MVLTVAVLTLWPGGIELSDADPSVIIDDAMVMIVKTVVGTLMVDAAAFWEDAIADDVCVLVSEAAFWLARADGSKLLRGRSVLLVVKVAGLVLVMAEVLVLLRVEFTLWLVAPIGVEENAFETKLCIWRPGFSANTMPA